ncbi:undecaprenyl-phosphate glucose phosphotransferase [Telmatospirillum siberiense]|nr:undecaprenyl-phosphate glucose phosphotransferase [Telmatospirillum siberiense]
MLETTASSFHYSAAAKKHSGFVLTQKIVLDCMRLYDAAVIAIGALVSHLVYLGRFSDGRDGIITYSLYGFIGAIGTCRALHLAGTYDFRNLIRLRWQFSRITLAWILVLVTGLALAFLAKSSSEISRGWVLLWFSGSLTTLLLGRVGVARLIIFWSRQGKFQRRVALVTTDETREKALRRFHTSRDSTLSLAGVFDLEDIATLAKEEGIDEVILSLPRIDHHRLREAIVTLSALPVDVSLTVDLPVRSIDFKRFELRDEGLLGHISERPLKHWKPLHKRILDLTVALCSVVLLAPVMGLIAVLIKLDSPGPAIFRQKRYGYANLPITIFKFRTLRIDATDADAAKLVTKNDDRVTRVGRWLRKLSLDELPQIFNVINGDMSIVGPRPHAMKAKAGERYYEDVVKNYVARHRVKPGITGWAQVNGWRGETDNEEKILKRVEFDLYYIEHWSIWLDIKIMIKTIFVVFEKSNAY